MSHLRLVRIDAPAIIPSRPSMIPRESRNAPVQAPRCHEHRATGVHHLEGMRRKIARRIVFPHSDEEYPWPEPSLVIAAESFGGHGKRREGRRRQFLEAGDFGVWPFCSHAWLPLKRA
jgi:hypothetical protein